MQKYSGVLLITSDNSLLLQQRDSKHGIVNPGRITTFGGLNEGNETAIEGAFREITEETNIKFTVDDLIPFTKLTKTEDDGTFTELNIFLLYNVNKSTLKVFEGKYAVEITSEAHSQKLNLSDSARKIIEKYFKNK